MTNQPKTSSGLLGPILFGVGVAAAMWFLLTGSGGMTAMIGKKPPPISVGGTWLNTDGDLSWEKLGGKVVWLEFSFIH